MNELLQVALAQVEVEDEPERRRLDADVRVEVAAVDLGQHLLVGRGDRVRLVRIGGLLAEDVDRRHLPARVERANGVRRVLELGPGDVARRDPANDRSRNRRQQVGERAV